MTDDGAICGRQSRQTFTGQGPGGARLVSYQCDGGHLWFRVEQPDRHGMTHLPVHTVTPPLAVHVANH